MTEKYGVKQLTAPAQLHAQVFAAADGSNALQHNYGAGPWRVLRKITLPLILANVIVGGLFAFSFSMLEVSDSLILAQKAEFYPITRAIYELSQILGSGPFIACAFGVWAMLFLAATLAAAGAILGRKIGSIFKL